MPSSKSIGRFGLSIALSLVMMGCIKKAPGDPLATADEAEPPPLREVAARAHRHMGVALATWHFGEGRYAQIAGRTFDSLTPENEMKWETIEPRPGSFDFQAGDSLVSYAGEHSMRVRGHTLVWHNQLPAWVKGLSGESLRAAMIRHVQGVVTHYKGRIAQWDVVNEAIAEGPSGELRDSSPFSSLGPTYIDDAFRAAHEADPNAILFYNDYDIEAAGSAKSEAAFHLVERLRQSGVPIGGVGFQMHVDPRQWPSAIEIQHNMERYAALGLAVEITEMDVPVGEIPGTLAEKLLKQRQITHDIVAACVSVDKCSGVTFWGLNDEVSWLSDPTWGRLRGRPPHLPLPFDADNRPKPMYFGILEALQGR
jgi:endo-1,4-beta-xylanase